MSKISERIIGYNVLIFVFIVAATLFMWAGRMDNAIWTGLVALYLRIEVVSLGIKRRDNE